LGSGAILRTAGGEPGAPQRFATELAGGVVGQIHQHILNVRLDVTIDGENYSVAEVDFHEMAPGPEETVLAAEKTARRRADPDRARHWKIHNPIFRNGQHPA
jgi:primary-amine oxidase